MLLTALAVARRQHWRARRRRQPTGSSAVLIDLEGHGREPLDPAIDLSRTVGWFTTMYPGLPGPRPESTRAPRSPAGRNSAGALKQVKEQLRRSRHHGIGYGLLRWLDPAARARLAGPPAPQLGFNYLGRFTTSAPRSPPSPGRDGLRDAWGMAEPGGLGGGADPAMPLLHLVEVNADHRGRSRRPAAVRRVELGRAAPRRAAGRSPRRALGPRPGGDRRDGRRRRGRAHTVGFPAGGPVSGRGGRPGGGLPRPGRRMAAVPDAGGPLFHSLLADGVGAYLVQVRLALHGPVDPGRLRAAVQALIDRYPQLGVAVVAERLSRPVQVVRHGVTADWRATDLSMADAGAARELLAAELRAERDREFDFTTGPLLRALHVTLGDGRSVLALTCHHLLIDGWSLPLLLPDLWSLYAGDLAALPPARSYLDYLRWLAGQDQRHRGCRLA